MFATVNQLCRAVAYVVGEVSKRSQNVIRLWRLFRDFVDTKMTTFLSVSRKSRRLITRNIEVEFSQTL